MFLHMLNHFEPEGVASLGHDPPIGDYRNGFSIMQNPPTVDEDGFIHVPQGPGLGVEINQDLIIES